VVGFRVADKYMDSMDEWKGCLQKENWCVERWGKEGFKLEVRGGCGRPESA